MFNLLKETIQEWREDGANRGTRVRAGDDRERQPAGDRGDCHIHRYSHTLLPRAGRGSYICAVQPGQFLIGLHLGRCEVGNTFGVAGSLAILLFRIYYPAQILFFGTEFMQVYANRYGSKIVPDPGMVKITEMERAEKGIPHEKF